MNRTGMSGVNSGSMQDALARQLQKRKIQQESRQKEIQKVLAESDEINILK